MENWKSMTAMFNRRIRLVLNGVTLSAMVFAHAVSAAQTCRAASDTPQMAYTEMDCAEMASQNVCLQQYIAGDQNSGSAQTPVADLPDIVVLLVPESSAESQLVHHGDAQCLSSYSDPPSSIRFCSFQL
jgi:hypothetical protein